MLPELIVATVLGVTPLSQPNYVETPEGHIMILATGGGQLQPFVSIFDHWNRLNKRVIITSECGSACTVSLDNAKTCAMPSAMFGFHQARSWNRETGELGEASEESKRLLWSRYPDRVKAIIKELTPKFRWFLGTDLIPPC